MPHVSRTELIGSSRVMFAMYEIKIIILVVMLYILSCAPPFDKVCHIPVHTPTVERPPRIHALYKYLVREIDIGMVVVVRSVGRRGRAISSECVFDVLERLDGEIDGQVERHFVQSIEADQSVVETYRSRRSETNCANASTRNIPRPVASNGIDVKVSRHHAVSV